MVERVKAEEGEVFDIELEENFLKANEKLADENRQLLVKYGVKAIDIMGAIGSGKTTLIEQLVKRLKNKYRIAAFNGDVTTNIDAELIARHGIDVVQINTGKECHLDANLVRKALEKIDVRGIDLLFIENVGNLICPAEFPLGSEERVIVVSVTEGPFMVLKHPVIFMGADVVVINKVELAQAMDVDAEKLKGDVVKINPGAKVVLASCKNGYGVDDVIRALSLG